MRGVVVILSKPPPRLVVKGRKLGQRSRPELWILREPRHDLKRVKITHEALAPAPVVAVPGRRDKVPPELHLDFERRLEFFLNVIASGYVGGIPTEACILVGIAVVTPGWRIVVGIHRPARKLLRGTLDDRIQKGPIFQNAHSVAHRRYAGGDAEIILRQIYHLAFYGIVKPGRIEQRMPLLPLVVIHALPDGVR